MKGLTMPDIFAGSSPLARGLRLRQGGAGCEVGIIPARAGFTVIGLLSREEEPDHPRSRGVYCDVHFCALFGWGSSPLARGLRE